MGSKQVWCPRFSGGDWFDARAPIELRIRPSCCQMFWLPASLGLLYADWHDFLRRYFESLIGL